MGTLTDSGKAALLNAWGALFDNSGGNHGQIVFETAAHAEVATVDLNDNAFAAASGSGTVSIALVVSPAISDLDATGNASPITHAHLKTNAGAVMDDLVVDDAEGEGVDIVLTSLTYAAHEKLFIDSGSYEL